MTKVTRFALRRVHYMPKVLEAGILYVAEEFDVAGHLCACGCQNKVITPLGPTDWTFTDAPRGPSLSPSIGNWQLSCRSHYWIDGGGVRWSGAWSPTQVELGRRAKDERRRKYYELLKAKEGVLTMIMRWFGRLLL
jgi:hypothetical protein